MGCVLHCAGVASGGDNVDLVADATPEELVQVLPHPPDLQLSAIALHGTRPAMIDATPQLERMGTSSESVCAHAKVCGCV